MSERAQLTAPPPEKAAAVLDAAEQSGRGAMSALVDLASLMGAESAADNMDFVGAWMEVLGDPTFDKIRAYVAGLDDGVQAACRKLAHLPSCQALQKGEKYGLLVMEHRQTGQAFVLPWTAGAARETAELGRLVRRGVDPRAGAFAIQTQTFCHV